MKKLAVILALLLTLSLCVGVFAACKDKDEDDCKHNWVNGVCTKCKDEYKLVDYVSQVKLDENSATKKTPSGDIVRMYIDGDTTHFNVPTSEDHPEGVLKARYLAVNTPESTGQVEPYGKVASNYTKKTLSDAIANGGAVLVESDTDDGKWNNDTYGRTLAWVWYRPEAGADWRNLNLELLQKGLGYGSSASENRYGEQCLAALNQAMDAGLVVHSGLPDENYYYGDAKEITLKELRTNFSAYELVKVAFEGYVTRRYDGTSYVEQYDEEDGISYGIAVFYNGSQSKILQALAVGSHVRVVGTAQDFNGTWQVSGLSYNIVDSNDPNNTKKVDDEAETITPYLLTVEQFNSDKTVNVVDSTLPEDEREPVPKTYKTHQLLVGTIVRMENLYVYNACTTPSGTSVGAISLYCRDAANNEITVRTEVLYKPNLETGLNDLVVQGEFLQKTINVVGIVDWYNYNGHNEYQIRVLTYNDITVVA